MLNPTHLGLDTHKDTIAVAVLRADEAEPDRCTIPNTPEAIRKLVARLGGPSQRLACYESGPTGYDTYRILQDLGVPCDAIAPALIPRRAGQRVKTDQLDARNLARLHRAGELTAIRIPSPPEEALRDFIRGSGSPQGGLASRPAKDASPARPAGSPLFGQDGPLG